MKLTITGPENESDYRSTVEMSITYEQRDALLAVLRERVKQEAKWGQQNHDPFTYLAIITEELGETAQAALHVQFGGPAADNLLVEATHTAAVALAFLECLMRDCWQWPNGGR